MYDSGQELHYLCAMSRSNANDRADRRTDGSAPYWSAPAADLLLKMGSDTNGLSSTEAADRLRRYGRNETRRRDRRTPLGVLLRQFSNPLLLVLLFASAASALTGSWIESIIVLVIVALTVSLGAAREIGAYRAAAALEARVQTLVTALRDGGAVRIPVAEVVPGDVVLLSAGSLVPADGVLIEATDFHVNEAALTGESFPIQKQPGVVEAGAPLGARSNCVFLGTNVRSGTARFLVVSTGLGTQYGAIARRLRTRPTETEFDRGILRFGYLLTSVMVVMTLAVFVIHVLRGRPPIETLLFSVALAVGLSPELLPAILSINLARGASQMATAGVLVRRLQAIENLGSMDVLCTDKTGTLTEGVVRLEGSYGPDGETLTSVLDLAGCNAALETGIGSPLDDAIVAACKPAPAVQKLAEIPFDFVRRRVSVVVREAQGVRLVTKGAFEPLLAICSSLPGGTALDGARRAELERRFDEWGARGIRVLGIASRDLPERASYSRDDERDLTFEGFVTFSDRPKPGVAGTLADLARLGVSVKIITGDNRLVARQVADQVGLTEGGLLSGAELDDISDEALPREVERARLFVEVDPTQKERVIRALRHSGHVVGFLGDGVNDAPAMHAADTSLSVDQAVDVAREAADFVLLERDLDVIRRGIEEGRRTFANSMKYILTTTSANLGNMLSMALASLFLPFLPLLASQILLNNFLADVPALGLAEDRVDPEMVERPERWNILFIGRFMLVFGVLSSVFDFVTFGALLGIFHAPPATFRTGWFVESLLTELLVALVVRTRRPFFRSLPGPFLFWATVALIPLALALPYLPFAGLMGFVPLPLPLVGMLVAIALAYVVSAELAKIPFYRTRPAIPAPSHRAESAA